LAPATGAGSSLVKVRAAGRPAGRLACYADPEHFG
jgi:hypothetical protein